jgi:hypothetical protein
MQGFLSFYTALAWEIISIILFFVSRGLCTFGRITFVKFLPLSLGKAD